MNNKTEQNRFTAMTMETIERRIGWRKYADGAPITDCTSEVMRLGWQAANRAQATAETAAYMAQVSA